LAIGIDWRAFTLMAATEPAATEPRGSGLNRWCPWGHLRNA
jgi:hypothetical protein